MNELLRTFPKFLSSYYYHIQTSYTGLPIRNISCPFMLILNLKINTNLMNSYRTHKEIYQYL